MALDCRPVWPQPGTGFPPSRIRTFDPAEPLRVAFGSCRVAAPHEPPWTLPPDRHRLGRGADALHAFALRMQASDPAGWPQLLLLLGDQVYADDASPLLPKGTVIHVTAWYDNTSNNKSNPDPNQWVGYGDRTVDEMAHAWMNVVYLTDAEYETLVAERKAKTPSTQNQQ